MAPQEMAELADFQGKHANKIKSFLTTEKDRYRIVYDRDLVYKSRRICFFGTSNDYQILDDGWERRFWIFKIQSKVDLGWIVENKDQLWAEAVHWYKSGKEWHLLPHEEEMLEPIKNRSWLMILGRGVWLNVSIKEWNVGNLEPPQMK